MSESRPPIDFSSDRAKTKVAEDELGRGPFAGEIARRIRLWQSGESLVIGLMGPWGCGKTSLKNFIVEALETPDAPRNVVDFIPWRVSGHGSLTEAFFRELAAGVGEEPERGKKLAKTLRGWGRALAFGGTMVPALAILISFFGPIAALPVWLVCWFSKDALEKVREAVAGAADLLDEEKRSMSERKLELDKEFKTLERPILVVIDEIDRLTESEIREVFQLVKVNADFPNVVYLLLFDRDLVVRALNGISGERGGEYLEKIVQAPFHVPAPPLEKVHETLLKGVSRALVLDGEKAHFERERWWEIWGTMLAPYFRNLRSVHRFLGSIGFQAALLRVEGQLEVNAIDFVAVETIRVFEPNLYEALPSHERFLVGSDTFGIFDDDTEKRQNQLDALLGAVPTARRENARELVEHLFPNWNGKGEHAQELSRHIRVGSSDYFSRYFQLTVDSEALTQAEVAEFLSATSDADLLSAVCISLYEKNKLRAAIHRADLRSEEIDVSNTSLVITGFANVADTWSWGKLGFTEAPLVTSAASLVSDLLRRSGNGEVRLQAAMAGFERSAGAVLLTWLVSRELHRRENGDEVLFERKGVEELQGLALGRIRESIQTKQIIETPYVGFLLRRLQEWAADVDVREVTGQLLSTSKVALALLRGEMSTSSSGTLTKYDIDLEMLGSLSDIEKIEELTGKLKMDDLEPDEWRALRAFRQRLVWQREGKPNDYMRSPWDMDKSPLAEQSG